MQIKLDLVMQELVKRLYPIWRVLLRWGQRVLILLQQFWSWAQAVNLPRIPLTPIQWLLVIYFVLGLSFLAATPIFEASDEIWHFGMVEYLVQNGDLPIQQPGIITPHRQEGSQPPLYYALAAILISGMDLSDIEQYRQPNPHAQAGIPGNYGNKNLVLRDSPIPPLTGTPLAVYALRFVSLLMGAVTVWAVYQCGRLVAPQRPVVAWVATAITAFNPMFLFIAASVNNDNLVTMLNSLVIYLMLLTLRDGFALRRSLLIAVLLALAALSKLSALVLVPVIALAALWLAVKTRRWDGLVTLGAAMLIAWAGLAGWWYVRNVQLYGELFGTQTMAQVAGVRDIPFTIGTALGEFEGFRRFYWGVFGAANIQSSDFFYALIDFMVFTSMFGVLFLLAQLLAIRDFKFARHELNLLTFLLGVVLVALGAFFHWTAQTFATQGRLLFPFLAAISPLLAAGLVEIVWWFLFLLSPPDRSFVQAGQAVAPEILAQGVAWPVRLLGIAAFLMPFTVIAPQYMAPPTVQTLPEDALPVYARYEDVELIGYRYFDRRYFPGEPVRVTLYWRVLKPSERDYSISLALLDSRGNAIGKVDTYPGAGTLRTTTWQAGRVYEDSYVIYLSSLIQGRFPFRLQVGWWDFPTSKTVIPVDAEQKQLDAVMLNMGAVISPSFSESLAGLLQLDEAMKAVANFGDVIRLTGFSFDTETALLKLRWQAHGIIDKDYRVFVHVTSAPDVPPLGSGDRDPELPTHYWRYDERFTTTHAIEYPQGLPAGDYQLLVGWYDPVAGERLKLPKTELEQDTEPTAYRLFNFTVDAEGNILSPELDTLREQLPLFEQSLYEETATAEATSETTGEPRPALLDEVTPVLPQPEAVPQATPSGG